MTLPAATLQRLRQRISTDAPRVICIGLTAFDETWEVAELPCGSGKQRAGLYREGGGGMAANAAAAVARLGGRAVFWGRAGHDRAGSAMRDELQALGVDVAGFRLIEGARSSVSGILVDAQGERCIVNFRGAGLPEGAEGLPLHEVQGAGALLADPRWPRGAEAALAAARAARIPTVFDGDVAPAEDFARLLPLVDHAIFSRPGLADATGMRDAEAGLHRALALGGPQDTAQSGAPRMAAVTLGEEGLLWTEGGAVRHLAAYRVEAIDTTGAGDVFHGAYALAIACGCPIEEALRFASAVAALKCTRPGGRAGIPDLESVLGFLAEAPA